MSIHHMQIGEVAERTGLSLRTIRYYEEVGLITPSARTQGGFRLYTEPDVARLNLVKRMKPLGFSLDEMRDLLTTLDQLEHQLEEQSTRETLLDRLMMYRSAAEERCASLRSELDTAEAFAADLRSEITRQRHLTTRPT